MSKFDEIKEKYDAVVAEHGDRGFVSLSVQELSLLMNIANTAKLCNVCGPSLEDGRALTKFLNQLFH